MLDLNKLHIFTQVIEAGSFSKAAERLYMSQSGVSQHIQELEGSLGVSLFHRGRRGVRLTVAGETFFGYTRELLRLAAEAELAVTDVARLREGVLDVGATPGVSGYLLPEWMQDFNEQFPRITMSVHTAITPHLTGEVLRQQLPLAIIEGELFGVLDPALLGVAELQVVEQMVVVGNRHAWWHRASVPIEELNDQSFVMRHSNSQTRIWLNDAFQQHGIRPRIVAEFDSPESIKRMVLGCSCVTILPEYAVRAEQSVGLLRAIPIEQQPLRRTIKVIWKRDLPFSPVARTFLSYLGSCFPHARDLQRVLQNTPSSRAPVPAS